MPFWTNCFFHFSQLVFFFSAFRDFLLFSPQYRYFLLLFMNSFQLWLSFLAYRLFFISHIYHMFSDSLLISTKYSGKIEGTKTRKKDIEERNFFFFFTSFWRSKILMVQEQNSVISVVHFILEFLSYSFQREWRGQNKNRFNVISHLNNFAFLILFSFLQNWKWKFKLWKLQRKR